MNHGLIVTTENHRRAVRSVTELTIESQLSANLIGVFRNTFPAVGNYVRDTIAQFMSYDETEFNFLKASSNFRNAEGAVRELNFVQYGKTLLQTPEGFVSEYVVYLTWLNKEAAGFIHTAHEVLGDYYRDLARLISASEAKISLKDHSSVYAALEKKLGVIKTNLGSFFDSKTNNALRTADSLFSRGADIVETIELTKQLNKERLTFKTKEISSLTTQIAEMIDLLVTSSEEGKIPELSGPAARGIAEGALVAAHYVEMVGALRYRIDEVINAVGAMADQVAKK